MKPVIKKSLLAKSIVLALTSGLVVSTAMAATQPNPTPVIKTHHTVNGLISGTYDDHSSYWGLPGKNANGYLSVNDESRNVYYGKARQADTDTQQLLVEESDLTGHYINMGVKGKAQLNMVGSETDFIESGDKGANTNTSIVLDKSTLDGAVKGKDYDNHGHSRNKDYMNQAVIYQDKLDAGDFTAVIKNGSKLKGGINAVGAGNKSLSVTGSTVAGDIDLFGQTVSMDLNNSSTGKTVLSGITSATVNALNSHVSALDVSSLGNSSVIIGKQSEIRGVVSAYALKNTRLVVADRSVIGDVYVAGKKDVALEIHDSQAGNVDVVAVNNANILLQHASLKNLKVTNVGTIRLDIADKTDINGNVTLGHGVNTVSLSGKSSVKGDIDGGVDNKKNALSMDEGSTINGKITHFADIKAAGNNLIKTTELHDITVSLKNKSIVTADKITNVKFYADTSGHLQVNDALEGKNELSVDSLSQGQAPGTYNMVTAKSGINTLTAQFANKKTEATVRNGVKNDRVSLQKVANGINVVVKDAGFTNDLSGAMAGLEGARQSGTAVANAISSHLSADQTEGLSVWTDYLLVNGTNAGMVDYRNTLQGSVLGVDWTQSAGERGRLTAGAALGIARNSVSHQSDTGSFDNRMNGSYYSLYTGWQQATGNEGYGFFANGNFTFGSVDSKLKALNSTQQTNDAFDHLSGDYKGKSYNLDVRTGVNIALTSYADVQPYAVAGWSKATAGEFRDTYFRVDANRNESLYAGAGVRLTGHVEAGSVAVKPWIDASYTTEFDKKADFTVNAEKISDGKTRQKGTMGAGLDVDITSALSVNAGAYTNTGNISKSIDVLAGVKYAF